MPFFSIIIPTYNRVNSLPKAITSVLNQSFIDFELIVIDDGSTDTTRLLIEEHFSQNVKYVFQQNQGVCAARNNGAKIASGKYLLFLDSDDWLTEDCLQAYQQVLTAQASVIAIGTTSYFDSAGIPLEITLPESRKSHPLPGAFAILANLFFSIDGYDIQLTYSENSDLFLRVNLQELIRSHQVVYANLGGVCKIKENTKDRKKRYGSKRYESVKYFMLKHRDYFRNNPHHFINFKRIHAFSALQNNKFEEARDCFWEVFIKNPYSIKGLLHFVFVTIAPILAKKYYVE